MLIAKPFIGVEMSDSDRVLLDIIKLCVPQGGRGEGYGKKMECPISSDDVCYYISRLSSVLCGISVLVPQTSFCGKQWRGREMWADFSVYCK